MLNKNLVLFFMLFFFGLVGCEHTLLDEVCSPPDFVPYDKEPRVLKSVTPEYPEAARRAGLEGKVWVKLLVDEKGRVPRAVIQQSAAEIFNQPALAAAKQFLFLPAESGGKPVCVWVSIPFHFRP